MCVLRISRACAGEIRTFTESDIIRRGLMRFRITTWLFIPFLLFLKVSSLKIKLFKNFQGCFTVQLSMFFLLCYLLTGATLISYHVVCGLSRTFFNFFIFLFCCLTGSLFKLLRESLCFKAFPQQRGL